MNNSKREVFRCQIRKMQNERIFKCKRTQIDEEAYECSDEILLLVRMHMNSLLEMDSQEELITDMTEFYNILVEQDFVNSMLHHFQGNNTTLRLNIYWILNNLTIGTGIVSKLLFDLTYSILPIIYNDLNDKLFTSCALDILQNMLADDDIDVFEYLMTNGILELFNRKLEFPQQFDQLLIQISCSIVKHKHEETTDFIQILQNKMPQYIAFQCTFILARGLPIINNQLILCCCSFINYNDTKIQQIILKILDQVTDTDLIREILQIGTLNSLLQLIVLSRDNYIKELAYLLLCNFYEINDAQQFINLYDFLLIIFQDIRQLIVNAIKLLGILISEEQFITIVTDREILGYLLNQIDEDNIQLSFAIVTYIGNILILGDTLNDSTFSEILSANNHKLQMLQYSKNEQLSKQAYQILQCYSEIL